MKDFRTPITKTLKEASEADVSALRSFLFHNPSQPLVATGSGGAETVADFAALLYGARGGVSTAVSPYTLNSFSDEALKTSKVLLVSAGGHNNDIVYAAKRSLAANPKDSASFTFLRNDRNEVWKLFEKAGNPNSFDIPVSREDGFVSVGTPIAYFALLCKAFQPEADIESYGSPKDPFTITRNDGSPLSVSDLKPVTNYIILHGSWGRPVAANIEGKLVESGFAGASVYDYRNFCHGRFIFASNHLEDSAVILLVSPREKDIAGRIRKFLPASTKLIIIETGDDAPSASLDLLIRSTEFVLSLETIGINLETPKNPGKIDKRVPMWIPFMAEMKKNGPLSIG